jgi:hypothetical protein
MAEEYHIDESVLCMDDKYYAAKVLKTDVVEYDGKVSFPSAK